MMVVECNGGHKATCYIIVKPTDGDYSSILDSPKSCSTRKYLTLHLVNLHLYLKLTPLVTK